MQKKGSCSEQLMRKGAAIFAAAAGNLYFTTASGQSSSDRRVCFPPAGVFCRVASPCDPSAGVAPRARVIRGRVDGALCRIAPCQFGNALAGCICVRSVPGAPRQAASGWIAHE